MAQAVEEVKQQSEKPQVKEKTLIFQLGSFPWQSENEPTSGSAILHQSHHVAYNNVENVKSFSIYPSGFHRQKNDPNRADARILELDTDVPKYSHSGWKWSGLPTENYNQIRAAYEKLTYDYMAEIEKKEGKSIDLIVCHHTFMNVIVAMSVAQKRKEAGASIPFIVSFLHGTAMKMFQNEKSGDWKSTHHATTTQLEAFDHADQKGYVNCLLSNSTSISAEMLELFPKFDKTKIVLAYPGYNPVFKFIEESSKDLSKVLAMKNIALSHKDKDGKEHAIANLDKYKHLVLVVGKLAAWKRFDAVIKAAEIYESAFEDNSIITLIVGKQLKEENIRLQTLNDAVKTKHVFFPGPKMQPELVHLYNAANIGVFPSKNEPFGLVLIECLACGTPVIGANSGGPKDFVKKEIGGLVAESEDIDEFSKGLAAMVIDSVKNDWKSKMQKDAIKVSQPFTIEAKLTEMLNGIMKVLK
eukprot:293493_1